MFWTAWESGCGGIPILVDILFGFKWEMNIAMSLRFFYVPRYLNIGRIITSPTVSVDGIIKKWIE